MEKSPHAYADSAHPAYRVGRFEISRSAHALTLRQENRGGLSLGVCLILLILMVAALTFGLLGIIQMAATPPLNHVRVDDPGRFFAPDENQYGLLWLGSCGLLLILTPLLVRRAYGASLILTFDRANDTLMRNGREVTRLRRIERLTISETLDPDSRYLYLLELVYGDGRVLLIHEGYDERDTMNLANEVSVFVGSPVVWK